MTCNVPRIGPGRERKLREWKLSYGYSPKEGAAQMAFLKWSFIQAFSSLRIQPHSQFCYLCVFIADAGCGGCSFKLLSLGAQSRNDYQRTEMAEVSRAGSFQNGRFQILHFPISDLFSTKKY